MVVVPGLTLTNIIGAIPLNALPLDKVPLMVPLPVTVSVKFVELPLHIVVVPVIIPVGLVFIVKAADSFKVKGEGLKPGLVDPIESLYPVPAGVLAGMVTVVVIFNVTPPFVPEYITPVV